MLHVPKTSLPKVKEIERKWHLLDAKDMPLGRLATRAAFCLLGKNKKNYVPHLDLGDYVVVINAKKIKVTGKKMENKFYRHHTGFIGHLKEARLKEKMETDSSFVIFHAVSGMIHENRLKDKRLARLKIFIDEKHPYQDKLKFSLK